MNFHERLLSAVTQYGGPLYCEKESLPHPAAMINSGWLKVRESALKFLSSFENPNMLGGSQAEVLSLYVNFIYAATEYIECLTQSIPLCFIESKHRHLWAPKFEREWHRHPTIICNKLKHEQNRLFSVIINHTLGMVVGYSIGQYRGETMQLNPDVHKKQKAFAYGNDLRLIIANIAAISSAIESEILKHGSDYPFRNADAVNIDSATKELFTKLSIFMPFTVPDQQHSKVPIFFYTGDSLDIAPTGGKPLLPVGNMNVTLRYSGDGYA